MSMKDAGFEKKSLEIGKEEWRNDDDEIGEIGLLLEKWWIRHGRRSD